MTLIVNLIQVLVVWNFIDLTELDLDRALAFLPCGVRQDVENQSQFLGVLGLPILENLLQVLELAILILGVRPGVFWLRSVLLLF